MRKIVNYQNNEIVSISQLRESFEKIEELHT